MTKPGMKSVRVVAIACLLFLVAVTVLWQGRQYVGAGTSTAADAAIWGDTDCSGGVTIGDAQKTARSLIGLSVSQTPPCFDIGAGIDVDGTSYLWADVDCNGAVTIGDAQKIARKLIGLIVTQAPSCPEIGSTVTLGTGVRELAIGSDWKDYGDAPDGTPTSYASGAATGNFTTMPAHAGPQHPWPFKVWLGEFASMEPSPADGNDASDDGVLSLDLHQCATSSALIVVNLGGLSASERSQPVYFNLQADWNRDGGWLGADSCANEWAIHNQVLDLTGLASGADLQVFAVDFPGGAQVSEFWMRAMVSTQQYDPAVGGVMNGETEDYLVEGGSLLYRPPLAVAQPAGPVRDGAVAKGDFVCKGVVVPHGGSANMPESVTFNIEQTQKSKEGGLRPSEIKPDTAQPTKKDGSAVGANGPAWTKANFETKLPQGLRASVQMTLQITSKKDGPNRLEGPFIVNVKLNGKSNKGDFTVNVQCAFYVDHTAVAEGLTVGPDDGFPGLPGHAGDKPGIDDHKEFMIIHGKTTDVFSDTNADDAKTTVYDKNSITVFGDDGAQAATTAAAGIKKITPSNQGRALRVETVKDPRDPPVQRVIIRVKGRRPDGRDVYDYFRITIIHETENKKIKTLLDTYNSTNISLQTFDEDEADQISYSDGANIAMVIPPFNDATWEPEQICSVGASGQVSGLMNPQVAPAGTLPALGFILDYTQGGSDFFQLDGQEGTACTAIAHNLTGFGAGNSFFDSRGSACSNSFVGTENNSLTGAFRLFYAPFNGAGPQPVPGGDSMRDPFCNVDDADTTLVASAPLNDGSSGLFSLPFLPCGGVCPNAGALQKQQILGTSAANEHLVHPAISPDKTMIAYEWRIVSGNTVQDAQIWIADFNSATYAITNPRQLTNAGFNGFPTWSPHSDSIAFVSGRDGNQEIYVMNAGGSGQTNLTHTPNLQETTPSWQAP